MLYYWQYPNYHVDSQFIDFIDLEGILFFVPLMYLFCIKLVLRESYVQEPIPVAKVVMLCCCWIFGRTAMGEITEFKKAIVFPCLLCNPVR
jgi:hypothetical protein